jgi:uncharacterized protein
VDVRNQFRLPLEPDDAFRLLLNLDQVVPCMPGAELGGMRDDGARELSVSVRLGPMSFTYAGAVRIAEQDPVERQAVIVGSAEEKRGQGTAKATITMNVCADAEGGATVDSVGQIELTGRAAQTGRGIVEGVAQRMMDDMARSLAERSSAWTGANGAPDAPAVEGGTPQPARAAARPMRGGRLLIAVLWDRVKRFAARLARK